VKNAESGQPKGDAHTRGEITGPRWADVDLEAKTLAVSNNRAAVESMRVEGDPKSETSRRTLPLPNRLVSVLRAARRPRRRNG
jgi:hypothetical protein